MKALVPFNNAENFDAYKAAGAGEFYIGFWDPEWHKAFGEYADLNRLTGYKDSANCNTFEEILDIIPKVKEEKLKIYVTFNTSIYSQEQLDFMEHDKRMNIMYTKCHLSVILKRKRVRKNGTTFRMDGNN